MITDIYTEIWNDIRKPRNIFGFNTCNNNDMKYMVLTYSLRAEPTNSNQG